MVCCTGTIRSNLDPFSMYDDARLWDALRRSYLVEPTADKDREANLELSEEDDGDGGRTGAEMVFECCDGIGGLRRVVDGVKRKGEGCRERGGGGR